MQTNMAKRKSLKTGVDTPTASSLGVPLVKIVGSLSTLEEKT